MIGLDLVRSLALADLMIHERDMLRVALFLG